MLQFRFTAITIIAIYLSIAYNGQLTKCSPLEYEETMRRRLETDDDNNSSLSEGRVLTESNGSSGGGDEQAALIGVQSTTVVDSTSGQASFVDSESLRQSDTAASARLDDSRRYEEYLTIYGNARPSLYAHLLIQLKLDAATEERAPSDELIPISMEPSNFVSSEMEIDELIELINASEIAGEPASYFIEDTGRKLCPICKEPLRQPFQDDETTICGHEFHLICINRYILARHNMNDRCPVCRKNLKIYIPKDADG